LTQDPAIADKFDDEDYPAYTMGRAAEMLGVSQAFLRSVEHARLFVALALRAGTVATPATSCGWPPEYAKSLTRAHRWRPPAALSSSRTSFETPSPSTSV